MRSLVVLLVVSFAASAAEPYAYSPAGKRDPFEAPKSAPQPGPDPAPCTSTLCAHPLADLKLVAIVANGPSSVAMFEEPGGEGLVARRHTPVGKNGGVVSDISRDCVVITEYLPTPSGKSVANAQKLCLPRAPSEAHELMTDTRIAVP